MYVADSGTLESVASDRLASAAAGPRLWHYRYGLLDGLRGLAALTVVATHLNNLVTSSSATLFGIDEAEALIAHVKDHYPQLAQALIKKQLGR